MPFALPRSTTGTRLFGGCHERWQRRLCGKAHDPLFDRGLGNPGYAQAHWPTGAGRFAGMLRPEVSQGCRNHSVRHDRASSHGNHLLHAQQSKGEWNYTIQDWATPNDMDWKRWMGSVDKKIPFNADHYFRWRKYYPYCAGLLGDLLPHLLHPYMLATGSPEFPARVVSLGIKALRTDKNTPGTYERDVEEMFKSLWNSQAAPNLCSLKQHGE